MLTCAPLKKMHENEVLLNLPSCSHYRQITITLVFAVLLLVALCVCACVCMYIFVCAVVCVCVWWCMCVGFGQSTLEICFLFVPVNFHFLFLSSCKPRKAKKKVCSIVRNTDSCHLFTRVQKMELLKITLRIWWGQLVSLDEVQC